MATLVDSAIDHPDWIFEQKFDGLRVQVRFDGRDISLISRNNKPQESFFPELVTALQSALIHPAVLDGEIVCFDDQSRTSFRMLQQRFHLTDPSEVRSRSKQYPVSLYLFDLLWLDGRDLTGEPLLERKRLLRKAVHWTDQIRWTEFHQGKGKELFQKACRRGEEGIVGKLASSRYVGRRDPAWIKIKCLARQEFVVGGFTDPQRSRVGIGALLVGYYDGNRLAYAGKVGTGYTQQTLLDLRQRLDTIEQSNPPFEKGSPPTGKGIHWVNPKLVAEIGFAEWTVNDLLRQPRFEGLRVDKSPRECHREKPRQARADPIEAEKNMPKSKRASPSLDDYEAKRKFQETPEPPPRREAPREQPIFVVQKHDATRLHYDFRLEADGVLKSWAVTKEPSLEPAVKRLAIHVEDHPLAYAQFEGTIPEGHYGAGKVSIWDRGTFENAHAGQSINEGVEAGKLTFVLHGDKLNGRFSLVRMSGRKKSKKDQWLLIKAREEYAKANELVKDAPKRTARTRSKTNATDSRPKDVEVTNATKVMYPADGITKKDIVDYYRSVAKRLLPFLENRPITLERLPDGLGEDKPHFWQKHTPDSYPSWIPRIELETEQGKPVKYVLVNDLPTLLFLVNQGTITFHPWLSRLDDLDHPDFVLFDLDPGEATFADAVSIACGLHEYLTSDGREVVVKTSGKSGLHILTPWRDKSNYDEARAWALKVAQEVAAIEPKAATIDIRKSKRGQRVYIDVMQNARGHHVVPPYVLRPVPGAPVSTPLKWSELRADIDPRRFNIKTVPVRIARQKHDPMAPILASL